MIRVRTPIGITYLVSFSQIRIQCAMLSAFGGYKLFGSFCDSLATRKMDIGQERRPNKNITYFCVMHFSSSLPQNLFDIPPPMCAKSCENCPKITI